MRTRPFGEAVRSLRLARSMSQAELADKAGVSQSYVSMIEARQRAWAPSRDVVRAFANALGVKERELLDAAGLDRYEEAPPAVTFRTAIEADPLLFPREKRALLEMYRAIVRGRKA